MSTGLRGLMAAGAAALRRLAGEPIAYRRPPAEPGGDWSEVELSAVTAEQVHRAEDEDGRLIEWHGRDFWIAADELVLGGEATAPRRGDRIIDAAGRCFEVLSLAGEPVFRDADPHGLEYRVHTKQVDP